jgi:Arc/MetJ-type ribon-helix-helix transcriptional regulator
MDLTLPPQLEEFIRGQVRTGRYVDEEEVVREAIRQMRALVKATEDPTVAGLVRDAIGLAREAQRDVGALMQSTERESNVVGDVINSASQVASAALDAVRKVPGAREVDRILRAPLDGMQAAAQHGELQARATRANLEATAKALGMLTAVLERVNAATKTVNSVISPTNS